MSYRDFINWLTVTPVGRSLVRVYASRLDPILYKASGGRVTSVGPQVIPQLVLTTTGRKSGKERTVQLGYTEDGDDVLVVASNLGGTNHPAWSYNLDANRRAKIQLGSEKRDIVATRLTDSVWLTCSRTLRVPSCAGSIRSFFASFTASVNGEAV